MFRQTVDLLQMVKAATAKLQVPTVSKLLSLYRQVSVSERPVVSAGNVSLAHCFITFGPYSEMQPHPVP